MGGTTGFERLYEFLCRTEETGESFTIEEMSHATDYAMSSVTTYMTKKFRGYVVYEVEDDLYKSDGVSSEFSKREFVDYMSQTSSHVKKTPTDRLADSLFERASDAILLALESYNRPSLDNRAEAFCMLATNAWELLLKGELVQRLGEDAIYKNDDSGHTISLFSALESTIPDENDPVRQNVLELRDLRNEATHLLLPDLEPALVELFQAAVLNFRERFEEVTGERLVNLKPGLLSIAVDRKHIKPAVVKRRYGDVTHDKVQEFLEGYRQKRDAHDSEKFAVSVEHKLVLTDDPGDADIELTEGLAGESVAEVVRTEKLEKTHPYRPSDVAEILDQRLENEDISTYNVYTVDHAENIRNGHHPDLHRYVENANVHLYSDKYVEWYIEKVRENEGFLEHAGRVWQAYQSAQS